MKILNISSIIPLEGLKRENDIVLRIQDYLNKEYGYEFMIAKSLPFAPKFLGLFSGKWKKYNEYIKRGETEIQGYKAFVYPWLMLPTSKIWVNYLLLPLNLIFFRIFLKKKLLNFTQDFDLILAQNNVPDAIVAYLLARILNKPYVLNLRGDFSPYILSLPFLASIYKNANQIITHSPQNFKKTKDKNNVQLIPHPIDSIFFSTTQKQPIKPLVLISVCRLLKLKNLDLVINALAHLKELNYQFKYHIIGDGPELENLKERTLQNNLGNNIIFHGFKKHSEIYDYLNKADIFIMPSYPETLGRSFLEAAASNCIVIGHKNTGIDGLLKHNKSAILVDKNSLFEELKYVFSHCSVDLFQHYTINAQKVVLDLTWKNIGKTYDILYKKNYN